MPAGALTFEGGTLETTASFSSSRAVILESEGGTFDTEGSTLTLTGVVSGSGALTKTGDGTLVLGGTNTYSGGTALDAGTVRVSADANLGNASGALTFDGGTLETTASFSSSRAVTLEDGGGTIDTQGNSLALAGDLSGTGTLTKTGAGTLVLTGINSYTGGTTVSEGTLQGDSDSLQGNILDNASVVFDQTANGTYSGNLSGTGTLTKTGTGTLVLTGTNSYTGGTTVSVGTLQGDSGSLQGNILDNASVVFDQASTGTYSGVLSGTGSLTKTGAGTLVLTGANTYTGGTTVSGGTLQGNSASLRGNILDNASVVFDQAADGTYSGVLSGTGSLTKTGTGTLVLTGNNTYTGGTTVSDGTLQGDSGSLQGNILDNALVVFDQTTDGTYGGVLSGTGALTKTGDGTLVLTGANTYTGGTTVSDGTLQGNSASLQGNIQDNASVVFDQTADGTYGGVLSGTGTLTKTGTGTLVLTGANSYTGGTTVSVGTLQGDSGSLQGNIIDNASVVFDQASTGTYSGVLSGTGSLTKTGTGTLVLTGANTYTGGTTVSDGTLQGNSGSLQGNILDNASVVFDQASTGTYSGVLSGTGTLTKTGAGTLVLTGANTYTGGTTVSNGTLQGDSGSLQGNILDNASVVFDQMTDGTYGGVLSGTGTLTKTGTGTLVLTGNNTYTGGTTVSDGTLQGDSGSLQGNILDNASVVFDQTADGTYSGNLSGTGTLTKTGTGTLVLTGANSYTGGTTVSVGTLQGDSGSLQGNIIDNASVVFDQASTGTYSGVLSGTGSLTKTGTGTLVLTGANTYTGGTTVSDGTLQGDSGSLQGNILDNALVVFDQTTNGTYGGVLSGTGTLTKTGTGTLVLTGANTYTGGTTVSDGALQGDSGSLQGNILDNALVIFDQASTGTYGGVLSGTGTLTKTGTGTLVLTGNNTYTGGTTVSDGTLQGDSGSLQGNILDNASVVFDQATNGTYSGVLSGSGNLTKTGTGTLVLAGANTYAGGTTIDAGTLSVNGSLASGVTVETSGTLAGTGTITGTVTNRGVLAPGNSIGTLTIAGDYVQAVGSTYLVQADAAGRSDELLVTGTATLDGGTVAVLAETGTYRRNTTYTILEATGGVTGTFSEVTSNLAFLTANLSYDDSSVELTLTRNNLDFAGTAQTRNQRAVASALDQIPVSVTGDMGTVLDSLLGLSAAGSRRAYDKIGGLVHAALGETAGAVLEPCFGTVQGRMGAFMAGGNAQAFQSSATAGGSGEARGTLPLGDDHGSGLWVQGYSRWDRRRAGDPASRYDSWTRGFLVGLDRALGDHLLVGAALGSSENRTTMKDLSEWGRVGSTEGLVYAAVPAGPWYWTGTAAYARQSYDVHRSLAFGDISRTARARYGGHSLGGATEVGRRCQAGSWTLTPTVGFQATHLVRAGFSETGAGALNLRADASRSTSFKSSLGVQAQRGFGLGSGRLVVDGKLGWQHEFRPGGGCLSATLAGSSLAAFTVQGDDLSPDSAAAGFGLTYEALGHARYFVRYDALLAKGRTEQEASLGLRYAW